MEDKIIIWKTKKINEKESIAIITAMIERTKERYMLGDGNILLMWGYVTLSISIPVWVLLALTHNPAVNWLWFLIWVIGGIASPLMSKKMAVKKGAKSYTDRITTRIWSVVGWSAIAASLLGLAFMLIKGLNAWAMMFAFALVEVPLAEIMQGLVVNEKSYLCGGAIGLVTGMFTLCCVAAGIPLLASWYMPVFIAAFVCMTIIPGHVINYKAKRTDKRT